MNYTEGEWTIDKWEGKPAIRCKTQFGYPLIAKCYVDAEANVHLITASPQMYGALKELDYCYSSGAYQDRERVANAWVEAKKAIAKAEGEEVK